MNVKIWRKKWHLLELLRIANMKCGLKRILESKLNSPNKEHTIIAINEKSIENIKNIRFETILIMDLAKVENEKEALNELLKNSKYVILNADIETNLEVNNIKLNIITFGFNSKSTITASSVEENFIICLQRKIINTNKEVIEPQEIEVKIIDKKLSNCSHNLMGIASILLIYGKTEIFF